jgi:hypothetical protein
MEGNSNNFQNLEDLRKSRIASSKRVKRPRQEPKEMVHLERDQMEYPKSGTDTKAPSHERVVPQPSPIGKRLRIDPSLEDLSYEPSTKRQEQTTNREEESSLGNIS